MRRDFSLTPPKVLFHKQSNHGPGQYRIIQPASMLRKSGYAITQVHEGPLHTNVLKVLDPDVVVFQIWWQQTELTALAEYRKALPNALFVYEIDDLFWEVPDASFHKHKMESFRLAGLHLPAARENIRKAAKQCDVITATNATLAGEMRKLTGLKDVRIRPNRITRKFLNDARAGRLSSAAIKSDKPRIGWAGGIGHGGDLEILRQVMALLGDSVVWVFMGLLPNGVDASMVEAHGGVPFDDYPRKLGTLNLDIALAPLEDNPFNRCKSDLRILEYAAAGFPVIASNIACYNSTPATLLVNDPEVWAAEIRFFADNPQNRITHAENLHEWVKAQLLDDHMEQEITALLPINAKAFKPILAPKPGIAVTVGGKLGDLPAFKTIQEAWKAAPGADIFHIRPGTKVTPEQGVRLFTALKEHASVTAMSNDGTYPVDNQFTPLTEGAAEQLDQAAQLPANEAVPRPYPAGPVMLLSGTALARFGLPDEARFGSVEHAVADWGMRCLEGGIGHVMATNTFIRATGMAEGSSQQAGDDALRHISVWCPWVGQIITSYHHSDALSSCREDLELAHYALNYSAPVVKDYTEWAQTFDTLNDQDIEAIKADVAAWETHPVISVIMPMYNTPQEFLHPAIQSVLNQVYPHWQLMLVDDASTEQHVRDMVEAYAGLRDKSITVVLRDTNGHISQASNSGIEKATGDWVVFLDHDDMLAPHALYMVAREIIQHPDAKFIYSDSDKLNAKGERCHPYFTPDFSYELLLAQNYVTHLSAYRTEGVRDIGGFRVGFEGSQDWDLALRYLEAECGYPLDEKLIRHIPHMLYHWRESPNSTASNIMAKPYALEAGRRAVLEHLNRTKQSAFITENPVLPVFNMVRWLVDENPPKVEIIIPSKDNTKQLQQCVNSVLGKTAYGNYHITVVDTGTKDATRTFLNRLIKIPQISVLRIPGPFNYSAVNNTAVEQTDAEFVCLLNDDIEIIEPGWLNDLVGLANRPGVGTVGAKMLYPNDTVQQCGITFDTKQSPGLSALHLWQKLPSTHPGQMGRALITQPCLAVTGACMVIRRSLYQEAGGLDIDFPLDFNDVDLCLRLRKKGYRNIVSAQALMYHHEGHTKKQIGAYKNREGMLEAEQRLLAKHSDIGQDPYFNPNLAHTPHMAELKTPAPAKPWDADERPRLLVVNGLPEKALTLYQKGWLPYCASLEGHYLHFIAPTGMMHVGAIDTRESTERLRIVLAKLAINDVMFCGIGDGTLASVGFIASLAEEGLNVHYQPSEHATRENKFGYYDETGWQSVWKRLLAVVANGSTAFRAAL